MGQSEETHFDGIWWKGNPKSIHVSLKFTERTFPFDLPQMEQLTFPVLFLFVIGQGKDEDIYSIYSQSTKTSGRITASPSL